ncbi:MAG TPA: oligosaccharide flippase family protein [Ktedonosporobacter sp.]|nr:oligosaccharide flippase family protein [Ktedonosporobacter sp.]
MDEVHRVAGRRSITRPGFWQLSATLCSTLIVASTYPVIVHILDPRSFGIYMLVQWMANVSLPILGIGTATLASRRVVEILSREGVRQVAGIFFYLWYRQCWNILLYCGIYVALAILFARIYDAHTALLLLLAALAAAPHLLCSIAGIILRSRRRFKLLTILRLFSSIILLLLIIIASHINGDQTAILLLASTLAATLTLVLAVSCAVRILPMGNIIYPGFYKQRYILKSLRGSFLLFTLDFIIWQQGELLLLALWRNPVEVGFYALSATISAATMRIAPAIFSYCILPFYLRSHPGKRYVNTYDAFIKTSCAIVFLAIPICIMMMVASPFAITALLGSAYLPLVKPLRILLIATAFGSTATISLTHLSNEGCKREQEYFAAGVALSKIVLAMPLIGLWGMTGAALVSATAQIISATGSILFCYYLLSRRTNTVAA